MLRKDMLDVLNDASTIWDVIVVGGGATGLGVGLDAAARGYRTLVLEQADFAQATSSRSTKLIHGGVRYLQQGNLALVTEALHERGLLLQNAPHLVFNQAFVVPDYKWWERPFYGAGLKIYDMLAGKHGFGRSRMLSREATLEAIPSLKREGLRGGVIYHDGQFDDARLAVTMARTVADQGGTVLNHVRVTGLLKDGSSVVRGVRARDELGQTEHELKARAVINATGPFVDCLRVMDRAESSRLIAPSQGVHLVLDHSFDPGETAIMVPHTDDGRIIFMVPWRHRVLVGTTDTPLDSPDMDPLPLEGEIDFLLKHAGRYLSRAPARTDVLSAFAGIRPLISGDTSVRTSSLSRSHHLAISKSGLISIAGGKWTTFRKMAEDTVTQAALFAGLPQRPCPTADLRLHGWTDQVEANNHLDAFGSDKAEVLGLGRENPELLDPLHPSLPYLKAEVVYGVRQEWAQTVYDVLAHRTRALILDARASMDIAPEVARIMATELGYGSTWEQAQVQAFRRTARGFLPEGL